MTPADRGIRLVAELVGWTVLTLFTLIGFLIVVQQLTATTPK